MQHRVTQARRSEIKWDRLGTYREKCNELAATLHVDPGDLWDEWQERAGARQFLAEMPVDRAEAAAWDDVLARFEVRCG